MKLTPVVDHLRKYCPTFGERIAGALDFDPVKVSVKLAVPCAFVIVTGDDAQPSAYQNMTVQEVEDEFDVVVALSTGDERGQAPADDLHDLRAELWRALLGWRPSESYEPIQYVRGELLMMNRNLLYYRFIFRTEMTVGDAGGLLEGVVPETWEQYELASLPLIESLNIKVDVIDPIADRNIKRPGPDGRIEFEMHEDYPDE